MARYYRRISLGKHIKLNVSKSGISTSIKIGGLTINPQRNRVTYNTPIKGLSLTDKIVDDKQTEDNSQVEDCIIVMLMYAFAGLFCFSWVFLLLISGQL